ncbi:MAG: EamA family transporter [Microbacterium gubbeenense]
MPSSSRPSAHIGVPVALIVGSCMSLQFGAALAVQLFPDLGTWGVTSLRLTIAALVLVVIARPRILSYTRAQWIAIGWFGLSLAGMNGFFYASLAWLPLGPAVALEFIGPLLLAALLTRRGVDFAWVGLAIAGVALFAVDGVIGSDPLDLIGVGLVLVAAAFWMLYIRASARVGSLIPGIGGLAMALVIAAVLLLPFGIPTITTLAARPELLWLAVGTAVFASVVPYTLELSALRRLPQRVFGVLISLEPVFAALFGWILLAQNISIMKIAGIALIVAASIGIAVAARKKTSPQLDRVLTGSIPTVTGALPIVARDE